MANPVLIVSYRASGRAKGGVETRGFPWRGVRAALLLLAFLVVPSAGRSQGKKKPADPFAQLHWRFIGPIGNRNSAVVGGPGNPAVVYVGAASGGIWKTTNGGVSWKPVFDHTDASATGALAVAPSAHNVVWAGTGETWLTSGRFRDPPVRTGNAVARVEWRENAARLYTSRRRVRIVPS